MHGAVWKTQHRTAPCSKEITIRSLINGKNSRWGLGKLSTCQVNTRMKIHSVQRELGAKKFKRDSVFGCFLSLLLCNSIHWFQQDWLLFMLDRLKFFAPLLECKFSLTPWELLPSKQHCMSSLCALNFFTEIFMYCIFIPPSHTPQGSSRWLTAADK